jgi:hypothetical protein
MAKAKDPLKEPIVRRDRPARNWLEFSESARTAISRGSDERRVVADQSMRAMIAREEKRLTKLKAERLALLAKRYGALKNGQSDWQALAMRLAEEKFAGFRVVERPDRGRPRGDYGRLWIEVERRPRSTTIADACRELVRPGARWAGKKPKSLEARYREERQRRQKLLKKNSDGK